MIDETGNNGDNGGGDTFTPESLSPEAQEYIRKTVQSEADRKTALATKKLQDETVTKTRNEAEVAEQLQLTKLAEMGDFEALGAEVASRLTRKSVADNAMIEASDVIERQMVDQFAEALGPETVEEIRSKVQAAGGAHAEFAQALAEATTGKNKSADIAAEVRAQLIEAGVKVREEVTGADKVTKTKQGVKLSTFEQIQEGFNAGDVSLEDYEAAEAENKKTV